MRGRSALPGVMPSNRSGLRKHGEMVPDQADAGCGTEVLMDERCGRHFWTAWHMVGPRRAERSCRYCGLIETVGEEDERTTEEALT